MATTGERMKQRRKELDLSAEQVAQALNVSRATVYRYENGDIEKVPGELLAPLARILNVSPAYLMGWSDTAEDTDPIAPLLTPDFRRAEFIPCPVLGQIACGEPILAQSDAGNYVNIDRSIEADFVLRCKGDSMIDAGISDGDLVYIRQQPTVENGEIAAVLIQGEEATLKRVYRDGDTVQLVAANPRYAPRMFRGAELEQDFRILGLAVACTHPLRLR